MNPAIFKRVFRYVFKGIPRPKISITVKNFSKQRLTNRKILITGGGKGIGYWIAKKCIEEGAKVLICGRNEETLKKARKELGESCLYIQYDVSDIAGLPGFIDEAFDRMGGMDSLISNAGISLHEGSFLNVTEKGFDIQFGVNFKAPYFLAKYFIEKVEREKQDSANVLFITSERGSFCTSIPYGLTKASIKSYVGALCRYYCHNEHIRVNALAPGVTASEMTGHQVDGDYQDDDSPNGRIFHPAEMANVACFLLSDESSCISGETIHCDCGRHLNVID